MTSDGPTPVATIKEACPGGHPTSTGWPMRGCASPTTMPRPVARRAGKLRHRRTAHPDRTDDRRTSGFIDVTDEIAEAPPPRAHLFKAPFGFHGHVDQVGNRQPQGNRNPITRDFVTLAGHRKIERHHERRALRLLRPTNEALDEASIPHQIELKPEWFRGVGLHVLDRADAHGRQAERYPERLGGAGG